MLTVLQFSLFFITWQNLTWAVHVFQVKLERTKNFNEICIACAWPFYKFSYVTKVCKENAESYGRLRLHNIFVLRNGHHVTLSNRCVVNSCHVLVKTLARQQVGPRPIIVYILAYFQARNSKISQSWLQQDHQKHDICRGCQTWWERTNKTVEFSRGFCWASQIPHHYVLIMSHY